MCGGAITFDFIPNPRSRRLTADFLWPDLKRSSGKQWRRQARSEVVDIVERDFEADFQGFKDESNVEDDFNDKVEVDVKPFGFSPAASEPFAFSAAASSESDLSLERNQQYPPQPPYESSASLFWTGYLSSFPLGTDPDAIQSFVMADRDWSGYIDEKELQQALCSVSYQWFSIRTVRLLMFLFKNPYDLLRVGLKEFAALWSCLGQWRAKFERFDRDKSGKFDLTELRDALYCLGYAILPSLLQALMYKYDDSSDRRCELNFDAFVEYAPSFL